MNPEYFQTRQEKLLPTALSLEEPNIRKQSPSSKQSVPKTLSPSEGVRDFSRELSPPTPETAAFQASGSQPVGKWNSKDLYIGVSTVQVTGNPKGTSVGKEAAPSQVRPREPMSVLMMANREVVNTELGSYRDSAENEECAQPMDDIQVKSRDGVSLQSPVRYSRCDLYGQFPKVVSFSPPRRLRSLVLCGTSLEYLLSLGPHFHLVNRAPGIGPEYQ